MNPLFPSTVGRGFCCNPAYRTARFILSFLSILSVVLLSGCASLDHKIFDWFIESERGQAQLQKKQVRVGDFDLAYLEGGQGDTILLIHGFESNKDIWIRFSAQLTKDHRVIAIDLPAHGDSTVLMGETYRYSVTDQAQRVVAMMEALQLKQPVHLMGHSMGGAIAYHVAALAPERVRTLGLMSAGGVVSPKPSEFNLLMQNGKMPLIVHDRQEYENMMRLTMSDPPYIPGPIVSHLTRTAQSRVRIAEKIFREVQPPHSRYLTATKSVNNIPTILIWGDKDRVVDVSAIAIFKEILPNSQTVIHPGIGHAPQLERAKESGLAYRKFLTSTPIK